MKNAVMKEKWSALLDGELETDEANRVLDESKYMTLIEVIDIYVKIGDVLREKEVLFNSPFHLLSAIRQRLESEIFVSIELDDSGLLNEPSFMVTDI